jgi:hypothetical protein
MSKEQDRLKELVWGVLPNIEIKENYRPDFLKNIKTGYNLEIDLYFPGFNVGLEYQGAVHFQNLSNFNNDSDYSRINDMLKQDLATHGQNFSLVIVEIFWTDLENDFRANLLLRIDNMIEYLTKNTFYSRAYSLEVFYLTVKHTEMFKSKKIKKEGRRYAIGRIVNSDIDKSRLDYLRKAKEIKKIYTAREGNCWWKSLYNVSKAWGVLPAYYDLTEGLEAARIYEQEREGRACNV